MQTADAFMEHMTDPVRDDTIARGVQPSLDDILSRHPRTQSNPAYDPDVIVLRIDTPEHGTWHTLLNLLSDRRRVTAQIAEKGVMTHVPFSAKLGNEPEALRFELEACKLMAMRVR